MVLVFKGVADTRPVLVARNAAKRIRFAVEDKSLFGVDFIFTECKFARNLVNSLIAVIKRCRCRIKIRVEPCVP